MDAPGTQAEKKKLLEGEHASIDSAALARVKFVTCDFQKEEWLERLRVHGLKTEVPTFIVWEGVSMYIPREAVEYTLEVVASKFEGPAAIVYDYISPQRKERVEEEMRLRGEPMLFGASAEEMSNMLQSKGLTELDHLGGVECLARYLPVLDDKSVGNAEERKCLVMAANKAFPKV